MRRALRNTRALIVLGLGLALGLAACSGRRLVMMKGLEPGEDDAAAPLGEAVALEDFEGAAPGLRPSANSDFGARLSGAVSALEHAGGARSLKVDYDSGLGSWGCGISLALAPRKLEKGRAWRSLEFMALVPNGTSFNLTLTEAGADGGDGEAWTCPDLSGRGRWKRYSLPLARFFKSGFAGNQAGDNRLAAGALAAVELQLAAKQGAGTLYIDDIVLR